MQVETNWKAAANLQLLLGESHPPVRIEHDPVIPSRPQPGGAHSRPTNGAVAAGLSTTDGTTLVDARNTANFRTTSYCSVQDPSAPAARRRLITYYREMLRRIPIWSSKVAAGAGVSTVKTEQEAAGSEVKREPNVDSNDEDADEANGDGHLGHAKQESGAAVEDVRVFRAVGILTQVHDPVGEQALTPWEFYAVQNIDDDACFDGPFQALRKEIAQDRFPLLFPSGRHEDGAPLHQPLAARQEAALQHESEVDHAALEGQRLSLYPKMLGPFTGLYPGMALGIVGDPFQRSARGVLTGVLLRDLVLPTRPLLPWRVDRPLSSPTPQAAPQQTSSGAAAPKTTRVHFCSGPFPRRDIQALLRAVTRQALHRGADVLIIGGPLVKPFEDFEKEILSSVTMPFSEMLDSFVDTLEDTLTEYYATRPNVPHMKIVLVSHPDDVTQVPVLPTTMYAMTDSADVLFRSNPCRIAVNGVHFSVCNEDVVGHMRDVMVERWPTAEGSLRRVVEALVQSRLYTPITELPAAKVDMKHLSCLRLDYAPAGNELLELEDGKSRNMQHQAAVYASNNWDLEFNLDGNELSATTKAELEHEGGGEAKRVKTEKDDTTVAADVKSNVGEAVEFMPHVMFLPSTRPQFAYVTHRGVRCSRGADAGSALIEDESRLDDTVTASGVMVVNQEVWSRRASPKFELRVAEVTLKNSELVARRGASAANGVACGVLHIYNADRR